MSAEHSLLIDVGNTSIKVAPYDLTKRIMGDIKRYKSVNDVKDNIQAASHIYLSNVAKDDITRDIQHICTEFHTPLFIAKTKNAAFGLSNAYPTPSNMGVDRWLAMLACMKRSVYSNFLVVDIGTAMTIDAIQNGKHLGGWIVPGASLLKQSLFKNTQKVFGNEENTFLTDFGNDTPACVNNGCTAQILGTLLMAEREMQKKVKKYEIFLTGGDKNIFSNLKIKNIIECENLVLDGLTLFVD